MKVNGGELVVKQLAKENIKAIFGLVGFYVSPIFAACNEYGIEVIGTSNHISAKYKRQRNELISLRCCCIISLYFME